MRVPWALARPRHRWGRVEHRRRLGLYRILGLALLGLVIIGIAWVVITGLIARSRLSDARADVARLERALLHGDVSTARTLTTRIRGEADDARSLTSGPAWWTAANLPFVGTPLRTSRSITDQVHTLSHEVFPQLVTVVDRIRTSGDSGGGLNIAAIRDAVPMLNSALSTSTSARTAVADTSGSSWVPGVAGARRSLMTKLDQLCHRLSEARSAVATALPMLGDTRPQIYFVGFENEAESRGLGGLPGAFGILRVDHGTFRFTHFANDTEMHDITAGVDLGADFDARYANAGPTRTFVNSDISPDFSDAARIWASMWQRKSGQRIDGALVLDPTALSYLLKVTGPVAAPGGSQITAANVVYETEKAVYAKSGVDAVRNAYLVQVAKAVGSRLTRPFSLTPFLQAVRHGVDRRRIAVWSAVPSLQAELVHAGIAAVLQPSSNFTGYTVVNAAGTKLDYYLDRTMTYRRDSCAAGATATATLTLTNDAPTSGLPSYVVDRADKPRYRVRPGDNRLNVSYYASSGATIESVTVDGKAVAVVRDPEKGLVTASFALELPVQSSRTVRVTVREPRDTRRPTVLSQPLVRPLHVTVRVPDCE